MMTFNQLKRKLFQLKQNQKVSVSRQKRNQKTKRKNQILSQKFKEKQRFKSTIMTNK